MKKTIEVSMTTEMESEIERVKKEVFKDISYEEMYCQIIKMGLEKNKKEGNYVSGIL